MEPKSVLDIYGLASRKPHGMRIKYEAGCRCLRCRAANSHYKSGRAAALKAGGWNGLVSAEQARRHILRLSKQSIGRRALAAASDVQATTISKIKSGERTLIRKRTEDRILGVSNLAVSDTALILAAPTWRQINRLIAEGFTKAELARRLGYANSTLRLGKQWIVARSAARVDRLYRMVMKE
jgi:hypothetical protein